MPKTILTTWQLHTYDVWGNAKDGYDVNDVYSAGTAEIRLRVETNNAGTPAEFLSAYPSDGQIRKAFGLNSCKLELDGDDISIEVTRARDSYPLGKMLLISHESLSPIRELSTSPWRNTRHILA